MRRVVPQPPSVALLLPALLLAGCGGDDDDGPGRAVYPEQCEAGTPPDEACYAERRAPQSEAIALAMAIADRQLAVHAPETLVWDWGEGVLLFALGELHRVTGEARYLDYLSAFLEHHLAEGINIFHSDSCAPAFVAFYLAQVTGEARYQAVVDDAFDYIYERSLRTEAGGLNHLGDNDDFGVSLWVDSLFMFGNLLSRHGERADDTRALGEMATQIAVFRDALQDDSGFFHHAEGWLIPPEGDIFWARGNAWVTWALVDYLRIRQDRGEEDRVARQSLLEQVAAVTPVQDEDTGLWWNLLDRPGEIYLETSASALFAASFARGLRYGLFPPEQAAALPAIIDAAMTGVRDRIEETDDGAPTVTGISGPTTAGNAELYTTVPLEPDISYGLATVILALLETSGLDDVLAN